MIPTIGIRDVELEDCLSLLFALAHSKDDEFSVRHDWAMSSFVIVS